MLMKSRHCHIGHYLMHARDTTATAPINGLNSTVYIHNITFSLFLSFKCSSQNLEGHVDLCKTLLDELKTYFFMTRLIWEQTLFLEFILLVKEFMKNPSEIIKFISFVSDQFLE